MASLPLLLSITEFNAELASPPSNLLIIDLGKSERFAEAHIPGAILVTPAQTQQSEPPAGFIPKQEALTELMRSIGLTPEKHVVVYDDEGGGWAGRFIWMLDEIGHTHYSYLDGGLVAWQAQNLPLTAQDSATTAVKSDISPNSSGLHTITAEELMKSLPLKTYNIWDARSPGEYSGEKANAKRAGHIPGAFNLNWTDTMETSRALRLKPLAQLRQELEDLGLDSNKTVVTHCQSHHRSGLTYLICKLLEQPVLAYAGSWGEWGNRDDTPVETND